jgi:xanthine dehydrogenase YagR molybdenum-binding subunit
MIGTGIHRVDGPLKVTGRAVYSYERQDAGQPLYGFILGASIGKGRIINIDVANAENASGVVLVMTYLNVPEQGRFDPSVDMFARPKPVLTSDRIQYFGEPVALVVATTFEQARAAAELITVEYQREPGAFDLAGHADRAYAPKTANVGLPTDSAFGDLDRAMREASTVVDETYTTPYHLSQAIEPPACLATWSNSRLTIYYPTQMVAPTRTAIANTVLVPEERVHVDAAFVGGGFGSKLYPHCVAIFAALAARPVGMG